MRTRPECAEEVVIVIEQGDDHTPGLRVPIGQRTYDLAPIDALPPRKP